MKILRVCLALLAPISPAMGAAVAPTDPPFSAGRIGRLPPEIRHIVVSRCGERAEAQHYFATYDNNSNVVRLDYSLLQCDQPERVCGSSGCLHQTFVKSHGRYALKLSTFGANFVRSEASGGIGQMRLDAAGHPHRAIY
jgi:hypothetical protein